LEFGQLFSRLDFGGVCFERGKGAGEGVVFSRYLPCLEGIIIIV
jgi:hypothetical protein